MERGQRAIDIARQHGWSHDPVLLNAYVSVTMTKLRRGELDEAEPWLRHAESLLRPELDPALGHVVYVARAELEFARGHYGQAEAALRAGERLPALLAAPRAVADDARGFLLQTLLKLGATDRVRTALAELDERELASGEMRMVRAVLELAERDPGGAIAALAPVLGGTEALFHPNWQVVAFCWKRLRTAPMAGRQKRAAPSSGRSIWPSRRVFSSRSSFIPHGSCWNATAGAEPRTRR